MPRNRLTHLGVLLIVASALIWLGAELTRRIEWILPYVAGVGAVLLVVGFILEFRKRGAAAGTTTEQATGANGL